MPKELKKQLKQLSADLDKPIYQIVNEAIREVISREKLYPRRRK